MTMTPEEKREAAEEREAVELETAAHRDRYEAAADRLLRRQTATEEQRRQDSEARKRVSTLFTPLDEEPSE